MFGLDVVTACCGYAVTMLLTDGVVSGDPAIFKQNQKVGGRNGRVVPHCVEGNGFCRQIKSKVCSFGSELLQNSPGDFHCSILYTFWEISSNLSARKFR